MNIGIKWKLYPDGVLKPFWRFTLDKTTTFIPLNECEELPVISEDHGTQAITWLNEPLIWTTLYIRNHHISLQQQTQTMRKELRAKIFTQYTERIFKRSR